MLSTWSSIGIWKSGRLSWSCLKRMGCGDECDLIPNRVMAAKSISKWRSENSKHESSKFVGPNSFFLQKFERSFQKRSTMSSDLGKSELLGLLFHYRRTYISYELNSVSEVSKRLWATELIFREWITRTLALKWLCICISWKLLIWQKFRMLSFRKSVNIVVNETIS